MLLAAAAVVVALLPIAPAQAQTSDRVDRLSGPDRFATAAAVSEDTFPNGARTAYVATGLEFADALAAGVVAARANAPVLLTLPDVLPDPTAEELERLEPGRVVIVGGEGAVTSALESAISAAAGGAEVERIAGANRFDTAAQLALDAFSPASTHRVYVATGQGFADALAGVPAAFSERAPLILVAESGLPAEARDAIEALAPDEIVIVGGTGAIDRSVEDELRDLTERVSRVQGSGDLPRDRFGTAAAVSQRAFAEASTLYIATGLSFPDALAGGPAAALNGGSLFLVATDAVIPDTVEEIVRLNPREIKVLGGTSAVGDAVLAELADVLDGDNVALNPGQRPDFVFSNARDADRPRGFQGIAGATLGGRQSIISQPPTDFFDGLPIYLDPTGNRVAFLRSPIPAADVEAPTELWTVDTRVGPRSSQQIAAPGGAECDVVTSRSGIGGGTLIATVACPGADDDAPAELSVVLVELSSGDVTTLERDDLTFFNNASISPDGSLIAVQSAVFNDEGQFTESDVLVLDIDDIEGTPVAQIEVDNVFRNPVWSADGLTLAYSDAGSIGGSVVFVDVADGSVERLFDDFDSRRNLVLQTFVDTDLLVATELESGENDSLVTLERDGAVEVILPGSELVEDNNSILRVDLTPDGDLLYNQGQGSALGQTVRNSTLWRIELDGSDNTQLDVIGLPIEGVFPQPVIED